MTQQMPALQWLNKRHLLLLVRREISLDKFEGVPGHKPVSLFCRKWLLVTRGPQASLDYTEVCASSLPVEYALLIQPTPDNWDQNKMHTMRLCTNRLAKTKLSEQKGETKKQINGKNIH